MTVGRRPSRSNSRNNSGGISAGTNTSAQSTPTATVTGKSQLDTSETAHCQPPIPEAGEEQWSAAAALDSSDNGGPCPGCQMPHTASASGSAHCSAEADSDREDTYEELRFPQPPPPKHIPFPDVAQNSEIYSELIIFVYSALAMCAQFLHLYRSVWWLETAQSATSATSSAAAAGLNATQLPVASREDLAARSRRPSWLTDLPPSLMSIANFYLIDPHLAIFIVTLLGRRLAFCIGARLLQCICPRPWTPLLLSAYRCLFFGAVLLFLGGCCESLWLRDGYTVIYICYPLLVYFITFGLRFEPFLRMRIELPRLAVSAGGSAGAETELGAYMNGSPLHCCSQNPATVRAEIEALRADYNYRFKQVVFTTILNAYYAAFVPCCFAPSNLFYDLYWAAQHLACVVVGGFVMCTVLSFPINYCDVMHRAALHLGQWNRMEPSKYVIPARCWSRRVAWPGGMVVRYHGELYKASGLSTMAVPGCAVHQRFFVFFKHPSYLYGTLGAVVLAICLLQLLAMYLTHPWHNIISLSVLLVGNYYSLFYCGRDFAITHKIYSAEVSIYERFDTNGGGGGGHPENGEMATAAAAGVAGGVAGAQAAD